MKQFIDQLEPNSTLIGFVAGVSAVLMITMAVIIIGCVKDHNRSKKAKKPTI